MGNVSAAYYISEETKERIEVKAKEMDRSASWLVNRVLSDWLVEHGYPSTPADVVRKAVQRKGSKEA